MNETTTPITIIGEPNDRARRTAAHHLVVHACDHAPNRAARRDIDRHGLTRARRLVAVMAEFRAADLLALGVEMIAARLASLVAPEPVEVEPDTDDVPDVVRIPDDPVVTLDAAPGAPSLPLAA